MRLTSALIPFIQEGIGCTMISRQPTGGTELREMLPSMFPFVIPIRKSRPISIKDPLGCCSPRKYLSGSKKRLLWISSWDCLGLGLDMVRFGYL
jgi:hypothetical protein